jgi:SAM-dependent methyltransferase
MSANFGAGFHVAPGRAIDASAYDRFTGRGSRLFVPSVLGAAEVAPGCRVLDVSTGTGEAALMALPIVGASGFVIGADISPAMLEGARARLNEPLFWPVAADGQALPFSDASFNCVICQLGLQFFPNPALGLAEFRGSSSAANANSDRPKPVSCSPPQPTLLALIASIAVRTRLRAGGRWIRTFSTAP